MVLIRGALGTSIMTFCLAFSKAGADMSAIRMLAPSRANRMHVSRPMPLSVIVSPVFARSLIRR
jgi:hypothetical protein